jgi:predicted PurR-regulated permease PerM
LKTGLAGTALVRWFLWLAIVGMVLILLVHGRSFLVPFVAAFLIFTVLSAGIEKVSRIRLGAIRPPYWVSMVIGLGLLAGALVLIYGIVTVEIALLIEQWPRFLERIHRMLASLSEWLGTDVAAALSLAVEDFNVVAGLRGLVTPAGMAVTTIFVIVLYIAFLFVEARRFPGKINRLFSDSDRANAFNLVVAQIITSLHRYLLLKTLLCFANAVAAYAVMRLVGLEFAETWAVLTFFLFFIPKIGAVVAFILPSLFAILQFEAWEPVVLLAAGLAVVQAGMGEVVEPRVMGRSLNLSPLVILLALAFWALVWGIAGAFLAVPITVVILTIFSKVPALRPVAILLSSHGDPEAPDEDRLNERGASK